MEAKNEAMRTIYEPERFCSGMNGKSAPSRLGIVILYSNNRAKMCGWLTSRCVCVGGGGVILLCLLYLVAEGDDVLRENVENVGLCVFKLVVSVT